MSHEAYPLEWPEGVPRTSARNRMPGRFSKKGSGQIAMQRRLTVADAVQRLHDELGTRKFPAKHVVVSTNMRPRNDGLPYSNQGEPDDPGVAVYFQLYSEPHCLPCDTFTRVADNIAAIAAHIEATRRIERYGVASVQQMYAGFQLLEAPSEDWWVVLGVDRHAPWEEIWRAHKARRGDTHPDRGGDPAEFDRVERAFEAARKERQ